MLIASATLVVGLFLAGPAGATFTSASVSVDLHASGAVFSDTVTPTPVAVRRGPNVHLSWTAVTISSGDMISYRVMRTTAGVSPVQVCTGVDAPVTSGTTVTCIDRKPGATSSYTVQAYVTTASGVETWSLPVSLAASA